jgi:hypothetical protein
MKTRRKLRRRRYTKRKRTQNRTKHVYLKNRVRKNQTIKRQIRKGGEPNDTDPFVIILNPSEEDDLKHLLNNSEHIFNIPPTANNTDEFIGFLMGQTPVRDDLRMQLLYQFRPYLLSILYAINMSEPKEEYTDYANLCNRLISRINMYEPTGGIFDVMNQWKEWIWPKTDSLSSGKKTTAESGKTGIQFNMYAYPDLSNPDLIGKDKEDIQRNPSKILDYNYRVFNNNPIKNAEHALNLIFFSPYLLETKGEDYVDFLTRPYTSQTGEVLLSSSTG